VFAYISTHNTAHSTLTDLHVDANCKSRGSHAHFHTRHACLYTSLKFTSVHNQFVFVYS